jgi:membrane-bound serine protease (ClpP class)
MELSQLELIFNPVAALAFFSVNYNKNSMKVFLYFFVFFVFPLTLQAQKVVSITVGETINPAAAGFIRRSIAKAKDENAECLLIHLNTPGGLLKSTRDIVGDVLDAPVPVVVYISPSGAHAGSAGVFITMAAHIAAMAPGTNIGAAHPVSMQAEMDSTMKEKATNDAVAFIRTIAEKRNRNVQWAEDAVRKSVSITGAEALQNKVIDLIAVNTKQLLEQIDGKTVEVNEGQVTLHTQRAAIENLQMSFIEKLLNVISDPNIAYILLMLGFYGILFELYNPGAILPGIIGVIALILGLYSLNTLPINYAGLALIIFAIILFIAEIKVVSHGMLAAGGILSLLLGSLMLIRPDSSLEFIRISRSVIIACTTVTALFFLFVIGAGIRAQRAKPVTGIEGFMGETGETLEPLDPLGNVRVHGEIWQAESVSGRIEAGEKILITAMKNLKLFVTPLRTSK